MFVTQSAQVTDEAPQGADLSPCGQRGTNVLDTLKTVLTIAAALAAIVKTVIESVVASRQLRQSERQTTDA